MKVFVDKGKLESHDIQSITDLGGKEFQQVRMWFETDEEIEVISLADYTKQVRKGVVQEIKKKAELFGVCKTGILKEEYRIDKEVLDQIQGEIK